MTNEDFEKAKQITAELKYMNNCLDSIKSVRKTLQMMIGKKEDYVRINAPGWTYSCPSLYEIPFKTAFFENLLDSQELFFQKEIEQLTKEFNDL